MTRSLDTDAILALWQARRDLPDTPGNAAERARLMRELGALLDGAAHRDVVGPLVARERSA